MLASSAGPGGAGSGERRSEDFGPGFGGSWCSLAAGYGSFLLQPCLPCVLLCQRPPFKSLILFCFFQSSPAPLPPPFSSGVCLVPRPCLPGPCAQAALHSLAFLWGIVMSGVKCRHREAVSRAVSPLGVSAAGDLPTLATFYWPLTGQVQPHPGALGRAPRPEAPLGADRFLGQSGDLLLSPLLSSVKPQICAGWTHDTPGVPTGDLEPPCRVERTCASCASPAPGPAPGGPVSVIHPGRACPEVS